MEDWCRVQAVVKQLTAVQVDLDDGIPSQRLWKNKATDIDLI